MKCYPDNPLLAKLADADIDCQFTSGTADFISRLWRQRHNLLVHSHGYKAGIVSRLVGRIANIPTVSTFHSGDVGKGKVRLYSKLDDLTAGLAPGIVVSRAIGERLSAPHVLIPNFVDLPPGQLSTEAGRGIAFVGRLSEEKGPDLFCAMAEQVTEHTGQNPVMMFGDGPLRASLQSRYGNCVAFEGFTDMNLHWHRVGLLCISSRDEGLPYVALEAMARGIPVAAFDVGGLSTLIRKPENGWLVNALDVDGLSQAVRQWVSMAKSQKQIMAEAVQRLIMG